MDTKWISTLEQTGEPARPAPGGTRGRTLRAVCAFLAFFLGVSLVVDSGLFFWADLSSSGGRRWLRDSLQTDYQNTQEFRNHLSNYLEALISMGAGGRVYDPYGGWYDLDWAASDPSAGAKAAALAAQLDLDKNVLFEVRVDGAVKYASSEMVSPPAQPADLPEGYNFLLRFDGERAAAWKDGQALDLYGDGYYTENSDWYLPGYKNFTLSEQASKVQVTMAVIETPQIFIRGSYEKDGAEQHNQLYWLARNLDGYRETVQARLVRLGAGAALLLLYVLLRKDKARADRALARGTGKAWFEVKVLAAALLLVCLLPRPAYLGQVWTELGYAYAGETAYAGGAAVSNLTGTQLEELIESGALDTAVTLAPGEALRVLADNGGWLLREYLSALADHPLPLLALFWGLYLLVFNDWRYNKKPWRHGVCAMLLARSLDRPIQRRLSRLAGLATLTGLLLAGLGTSLLLYGAGYVGGLPLAAAWCLCLPLLLGAAGLAAYARRLRSLWTDLGALADQTARLRAGALDQPLDIPPDRDLHQLADDLNHVGQGLHQAVEDRTRSERMKVELVTNVSHDLKTPLTSIISYTELLAQEPLEPPASEYVQILGEKAQRLRAMVQDVFEVSKAASGQLPVRLERLDLGRLLRQTLADMEGAIQDSGLALRPSIPEGPVPITADSDRLYRVFQNLIGNALKYALPGSRVYLTLAVEGDTARASVQNTSATELRDGTDYTGRFVRGDESRSDGGSGLGLSIADSFTRACGGELTITTQADLFTTCVAFPLVPQA